jgi:acetolactate synthase I/II/III large subunit
VLVTSGPGATNMVTGLTDALMDSIPLVCITGQVPTHLIGNDAFQECDTVGITRPCTKHNYLVKRVDDLPASCTRRSMSPPTAGPARSWSTSPRTSSSPRAATRPRNVEHKTYKPRIKGDAAPSRAAVELMAKAKRPVFYTGGGVINSGPKRAAAARARARSPAFPITSTLMGLGAFPASDPQWLGMLGMHGTYEANHAMHDCDVMVCIGARFDDRITGRTDAFSPGSKKIHIDIDPSSINKNVRVDVPIIGDCASCSPTCSSRGKDEGQAGQGGAEGLVGADRRMAQARLPALPAKRRRHHAAIRGRAALCGDRDKDVYITTEVGQHQMWAAQFFRFEEPNRWMTSGGLGTMGYGLPPRSASRWPIRTRSSSTSPATPRC